MNLFMAHHRRAMLLPRKLRDLSFRTEREISSQSESSHFVRDDREY